MTKMMQTRKLIEIAGARTGLASMRRAAMMMRPQHAAAISTWERVRSSMWHPMATMEQSLMDMRQLTSQILSDRAFPHNLFRRVGDEEDDFFRDLDVKNGKDAPKPSSTQSKSAGSSDAKEQQQPKKSDEEDDSGLSFSVYSFSSSTVLDADGHRVSTVRRRYEDSTGRLKALHEREIDGKKLKSVWRREHPDDKGEHHTICSSGSSEEFEEKWKKTPFGKAESEQPQQKQLHEGKSHNSDKSKSDKSSKHNSESSSKHAFGVDHEAAKAAPDKKSSDAAHGAIKEARERSRDQAIAEGSKNQEEETTPPSYS